MASATGWSLVRKIRIAIVCVCVFVCLIVCSLETSREATQARFGLLQHEKEIKYDQSLGLVIK